MLPTNDAWPLRYAGWLCLLLCLSSLALPPLWDLRCGSTLLLWVVFVASIARLERLSLSFQLVRARCAYPICTADICGNTTRCPARAKAKCKPSSNSSTAALLLLSRMVLQLGTLHPRPSPHTSLAAIRTNLPCPATIPSIADLAQG